jgi:hypothetical protein
LANYRLNEGSRAKLRSGRMPQVRISEWYFDKFDDHKILRRCAGKVYTLEVDPEDIEKLRKGYGRSLDCSP